MRRRKFIAFVASAAAAWPLVARAQQTEQMRRIGVLMNRAADSPEGQARLAAFKQRLEKLGWTEGANVRIDVCWGADDLDRERQCATELVALAPNILFASGARVPPSIRGRTLRPRQGAKLFGGQDA
jgi:putative tryptophan/tyrosine transport system substrate-binding protein